MAGGQARHLVGPHVGVEGEGVEEHDRQVAGAHVDVVQSDPFDLGERHAPTLTSTR